MRKSVLILSHTGDSSIFKIGSHHYANHLAKLNYDVYYSGVPRSLLHIFLRRKVKGTKKLNNAVKGFFIKHSIFPITFRNYFINIAINCLFWKIACRRNRTNYFDLVICDYPFFHPLLSCIKYNKLIYRPTDDYYAMAGDKVKKYERAMLGNADTIVCTSEIVKQNILHRYTNILKEIHVIENGYDSELFYRRESNTRNGCVYVGAIDDRFSFDDLEFLVKKFSDIKFDIYGPIDDSISRVSELSNYKNLSFKGEVEYENVPSILNKYKIGILPLTKNEKNSGRSPMKLWEYYSCGLNVVYSNIAHIKSSFFFQYNSSNKDDMCKVFDNALNYKWQESDQGKYLASKSWEYKTKAFLDILDKDE